LLSRQINLYRIISQWSLKSNYPVSYLVPHLIVFFFNAFLRYFPNFSVARSHRQLGRQVPLEPTKSQGTAPKGAPHRPSSVWSRVFGFGFEFGSLSLGSGVWNLGSGMHCSATVADTHTSH